MDWVSMAQAASSIAGSAASYVANKTLEDELNKALKQQKAYNESLSSSMQARQAAYLAANKYDSYNSIGTLAATAINNLTNSPTAKDDKIDWTKALLSNSPLIAKAIAGIFKKDENAESKGSKDLDVSVEVGNDSDTTDTTDTTTDTTTTTPTTTTTTSATPDITQLWMNRFNSLKSDSFPSLLTSNTPTSFSTNLGNIDLKFEPQFSKRGGRLKLIPHQ